MQASLLILFIVAIAGLAVLVWAVGQDCPPRWLNVLLPPAGRADTLLRQILGAEEYQQLIRCGYLDIPSPTIDGRIYRIPYCPGRVEVIDQGSLTARLCVVSTSWVPAADMVLTHKLLIEGDEARYLSVANHFPARGTRRIGRWYP
jgi:hypothetical protein